MAAFAATTMLPACATKSDRPETAGSPPAMARLFISPMGEPFRRSADGKAPINVWFSQADKNGDKRLSKAEFLADADAFFDKLDADKDGKVVSPEVTAMQAKLAPEEIEAYGTLEDLVGVEESLRREQIAANDALTESERKGALARPYGAQAFGLMNIIEPVMSADIDVNRRVTREEFRETAEKRFDRLDLNLDGFFTLAEQPGPAWGLRGKR